MKIIFAVIALLCFASEALAAVRPESDAGAYAIIFTLLLIAAVAIIVGVLRWALRINDIVRRLDNIVELLKKG